MKRTILLLCIVTVFGSIGTVNATLIDNGDGTITQIRDDGYVLMWLQDSTLGGIMANWDDAMTWAENLVFAGHDDWRLASAENYDGSEPCYGFNCANSEMGNLYYVELGNPAGGPFTNSGPFNIPWTQPFWLSTEYAPSGGGHAASFNFVNGEQDDSRSKTNIESAVWAIHDVDVIPIDIMPRTCPNECPIKGGGSIEVDILGTADFDVTNIDIASVRLEGVAPGRSSLKDKSTPVSGPLDECDCTAEGRDGFFDLCLKFDKKEIFGALGEVNVGDIFVLTLAGALNDETPIVGWDCLVMVKKGKRD
jgi:hypothetical protein